MSKELKVISDYVEELSQE